MRKEMRVRRWRSDMFSHFEHEDRLVISHLTAPN